MNVFKGDIAKYSLDSLCGYRASWGRWSRWCNAAGVDRFAPSLLQARIFVAQVASGGPTAGRSMLAQLRWLHTNMGIL